MKHCVNGFYEAKMLLQSEYLLTFLVIVQVSQQTMGRPNVLHLLKTRNIRNTTVILSLTW